MQSFLKFWEAYKQQGGIKSALEVGIFLIQNAESLDKNEYAPNEYQTQFQQKSNFQSPESNNTDASFSHSNAAAILIDRLQGFIFMESKPLLKAAGLANPDDFGILATLYFKPFISKGQLLKQELIEPATGTEILKKMKKMGWIEEKPNPEDGRSILVALTDAGKKLTENCFHSLRKITNTLNGLSAEEQGTLLRLLMKLDHCHSNRHNIKTVFAWMQENTVSFPPSDTI